MDISQSVIMTIMTAATPLLLAALGEVIVERSGVLNLGLEGMMATAAACGFAMAIVSGSTTIGVLCAVLSAMALAGLFGFVTLSLGANQVASGLALTIVGLGLSGLIGAGFVGTSRPPLEPLFIEGLTDLPGFGKIIFGQDFFVYTSWILILAILIFLHLTRAGLTLRCIGENHHSAHAIGLPVLKTRFRAVLFGGACAGLAGAYLSLVYTPFWSPGMTAGRGWIALSLVVFAAWRAERVLLGALLFGGATVLQLHAQAASLGLPSQLLSAVPYLATLIALVFMSLGRKSGTVTPGSLGQPFVPER
jgi:general nucleoside transport system permease protein